MADSDSPSSWRRFQQVRFDRKRTARRIRKAEMTTKRHTHKFLLKRWQNVKQVRRTVFFWMTAVACLILATGLQLYWDQQSYQTAAGDVNSTYAEALIGPVETLNPLFADTPATVALSQLLFSRILNYDSTGNLNYDLAKNVTISDDGLTYHVSLRDDVRWHDGMRLTADDVVFTTDILKDPASRAQIKGWDSIEVVKTGDFAINFVLKSPYAPFMSALTFPVVPKHILSEVAHAALRENNFSNNPIGSGPFAFRLLQDIGAANGRRVAHLVANQQYYRGVPKLAKLQIHTYANQESIERALRLGEVNGAAGVDRQVTAQLPEQRYDTTTQAVQSGVYAFLNTTSGVLGDKQVRQALQRSVDTAQLRKRLGNAPELSLPYTNLQLEGDIPQAPTFDITAAAALLEQAGWKLEGSVRKKEGQPLRISVVTVKNADYERALETVIGGWRQLGVDVTERVVDADDPTQSFVQTVLQPRAYDVLIYEISIGRDPDVFAYWHSSQASGRGLNLSNYNSPIANDILASARTTLDPTLRNAKHLAFARRWLDDAPAIGLYQATTTSIVTKNVHGIPTDAVLVSPEQRYESALYWTAGSRTVYKTP